MTIEPYDHKTVEAKWQKVWLDEKLNVADIPSAKRPFYNLMMFPYPSAEGLHVGNMYAFTGSDIYGRFQRMKGYDVFEPIGLDGFGIHSENFALKIGRHPMDHADITEKNFYSQLHKIGAMFDWSRTVETYDPDYYRWTQWIFVQMFKHGLAYRSAANVNWCPKDKTVLADEQVIDGCCERCGNTVEKRLLNQWFFRITAYAEKLLQHLNSLDWSEKVKVAQSNWIGKKEGIVIKFQISNVKAQIECFTTRPDTFFGASFIAIAPEHPLVGELANKPGLVPDQIRTEIAIYIQNHAELSESERISENRKKTGVFTGLYAINRLNNDKLPVYISDFVVMEFGTGAVVGVPSVDERDAEFAKEFSIPVRPVIDQKKGTMINSSFLNGLDMGAAIEKMTDYLEEKEWGTRSSTYHLRDWIISRQRYWGPPIPMIYCKHCAQEGKSWFTSASVASSVIPAKAGIHQTLSSEQPWIPDRANQGQVGDDKKNMAGWYPVTEADLPVRLPRIEDYKPGDDGIAPLAKHKEFYETKCPGCGRNAVRETDVSDTFLDSSWYFLRYPSVGISVANELPWDPAFTKRWLPVTMYTGGAEHAVLHLLYSRFVTMALKDFGFIDFDEPFSRFYAHGLVIKDGAKMSKSRGNVVNPDEYIVSYGADALRLYLMFMGPFDQGGDFRDASMEGMSRWVGRIWRLSLVSLSNISHLSTLGGIKNALNKLVKKVTEDLEKRRYNTAIASMMEFTNLVADHGGVLGVDELATFLKLLAPFAPHVTEELWQRIRNAHLVALSVIPAAPVRQAGIHQSSFSEQSWIPDRANQGQVGDDKKKQFQSIHLQTWPEYNTEEITEEKVIILVQVNGKLRDKLEVDVQQSKDKSAMEKLALSSGKVRNFLEGKVAKNVIFVPGRLVNVVV